MESECTCYAVTMPTMLWVSAHDSIPATPAQATNERIRPQALATKTVTKRQASRKFQPLQYNSFHPHTTVNTRFQTVPEYCLASSHMFINKTVKGQWISLTSRVGDWYCLYCVVTAARLQTIGLFYNRITPVSALVSMEVPEHTSWDHHATNGIIIIILFEQ